MQKMPELILRLGRILLLLVVAYAFVALAGPRYWEELRKFADSL